MGNVIYVEKESKFIRGFILKASKPFWDLVNNDPQLAHVDSQSTTGGLGSNITVSSYTFRRFEPELWFTKQHIHDKGAVSNSWHYMFPLYRTLYGFMDNEMVNRNYTIQHERGIRSVRINATNYLQNETLQLEIISEEFTWNSWWLNYMGWQYVFVCLMLLDGYFILDKKWIWKSNA